AEGADADGVELARAVADAHDADPGGDRTEADHVDAGLAGAGRGDAVDATDRATRSADVHLAAGEGDRRDAVAEGRLGEADVDVERTRGDEFAGQLDRQPDDRGRRLGGGGL